MHQCDSSATVTLRCFSELGFCISAWHHNAQYRHVHSETFNSSVIYKPALCFCQKVGTKKSKIRKFWAVNSTTAKLGDDFPVWGGVHLMYWSMQSRRIQYLPNHPILAKSPRVRKHNRKNYLYSCTELSVWMRKLLLKRTYSVFCYWGLTALLRTFKYPFKQRWISFSLLETIWLLNKRGTFPPFSPGSDI